MSNKKNKHTKSNAFPGTERVRPLSTTIGNATAGVNPPIYKIKSSPGTKPTKEDT